MTLNGAEANREEFWIDPSPHAGLGHAWRERIADKFRKIGTLSKVGTMSNGESVYTESLS